MRSALRADSHAAAGADTRAWAAAFGVVFEPRRRRAVVTVGRRRAIIIAVAGCRIVAVAGYCIVIAVAGGAILGERGRGRRQHERGCEDDFLHSPISVVAHERQLAGGAFVSFTSCCAARGAEPSLLCLTFFHQKDQRKCPASCKTTSRSSPARGPESAAPSRSAMRARARSSPCSTSMARRRRRRRRISATPAARRSILLSTSPIVWPVVAVPPG